MQSEEEIDQVKKAEHKIYQVIENLMKHIEDKYPDAYKKLNPDKERRIDIQTFNEFKKMGNCYILHLCFCAKYNIPLEDQYIRDQFSFVYELLNFIASQKE